jgi:hypothetical protein
MSGRARFYMLILCLLIMAAVAGWFILNQEPDHPLNRRNYSRIMAGMTRADVEAILGGPPGAGGQAQGETSFVALVEQEGSVDALGALQGKPKPAIWYNDRGQIIVMFDGWDQSARVVGKQLYRRAARR